MPNPRLSFRVSPQILEALPQDPDERSQFCIEAIYAKLNPPSPEGELGEVITRMGVLEGIVAALIEEKPKKDLEALDGAISDLLQRIRPAERIQAARHFRQLRASLDRKAPVAAE